MEKNQITFGDDQPKTNPEQDLLNYAPFTRRLAQVIASLQAPDGYVIGLHGKWGSGKTTALRFIEHDIIKHNKEAKTGIGKVEIIHFTPWIVSGHQDLIAAFFKILSENIGSKVSKTNNCLWKAGTAAKDNADLLVDSVATMAAIAIPGAGLISGVAGSISKKTIAALMKTPSLQKAYKDLFDQLNKSGRRFVVIIDDLDRLEHTEIKSILQLVKTVGSLPNIVYLLAYDREIVRKALDEGMDCEGPGYAEKIIQHEVELPKPSRSDLLSILDKEIMFMVADIPESSRWQYIVRDGINRWIRLPRDIEKLANAVKFSWPALKNEIDPSDLLAMEGLRLFDTEAYNWVRENKDFIFKTGRFLMAEDEKLQTSVDILKKSLPDASKTQILDLLSVLFPTIEKWFDNSGFDGDYFNELVRRRGIGSEAGYDAYWSMAPSRDEVPKTVIDEMIANLDNQLVLERSLKEYLIKVNSRGEFFIGKLLEELRVRFSEGSHIEPTQAMLDALFSIGEELLHLGDSNSLLELSPRAQIRFLIKDMLKIWEPEKAGKFLIEAFNKSNSLAFCANEFVSRGRELGIFSADTQTQSLISIDDFRFLGARLHTLIKQAVDQNKLADAPFYFDIVRSWAYLGELSEVKEWLSNGMIDSVEFLAKVARGLVRYSIGTKVKEYTMEDMPDRELYDLNILKTSSEKHLAGDNLDDDQRRLVTEILRGSKSMLDQKKPGI